MATANLILRTKTNPSNVYLRFSMGRKGNYTLATNIMVNPKLWDKRSQVIKNPHGSKLVAEQNIILSRLKVEIINQYNIDYSAGEHIDGGWLRSCIDKVLRRPEEERKKVQGHEIYLYDFCKWWMEEKSPDWLNESGKQMSYAVKNGYETSIELIKKYQGRTKIKLAQAEPSFFKDLVKFMSGLDYSPNTIKRHISRVKFFFLRAEECGIKVNPGFKTKTHIPKKQDIPDVYLNEDEIDLIYNYDFSYSERLDNARDLFIIGLWTGLRVSDFLRNLNTTNIKDGMIEIKTQKTSTRVTIPLHPMVRETLRKRSGRLPNRISDVKFNKYIKEICMIVGIDNDMVGRIIMTKDGVSRKETGIYPKYKLVTSHICRRSWATNLYGKIGNEVIQQVGGWGSEKMMLHYLKKSKKEYAEQLRKLWEKEITV